MLNDRSSVGVAIIVFYSIAVLLAGYLLFWRHGRPRLGWYLIFVFCAARLASGIVLILFENNQASIGLIAAATALLGAGTVPLVATAVGFLRIVVANDFADFRLMKKGIILTRILFFVGVGLLVAGGVLVAQYTDANDVSIGLKLAKAGYLIIAVALVILVSFEIYLRTRRELSSKTGNRVLNGALLTAPFIAVRLCYSLIALFKDDLKWSALYGDVWIFLGMVVIMEFFAVMIYLVVGYTIPPINRHGYGTARREDHVETQTYTTKY